MRSTGMCRCFRTPGTDAAQRVPFEIDCSARCPSGTPTGRSCGAETQISAVRQRGGAPVMGSSLPQSRVVIREVGLRDGLQSIATILPTARKQEWIRDAYAAGQREIEVGSFVPARLLPQLADTAEVLAYAKTLPGLFASVLVPNLKGARARDRRRRRPDAGAAVGQPRAQPRQPAQDARRSGRGSGAHSRRARCRRREDADRRRCRHGVRLHAPGRASSRRKCCA